MSLLSEPFIVRLEPVFGKKKKKMLSRLIEV